MLAKNCPKVVKFLHRIHSKLFRSPKFFTGCHFLYFGYTKFHRIHYQLLRVPKIPSDVIQNVIGYRKVKFLVTAS
jgi:hypothetical protein